MTAGADWWIRWTTIGCVALLALIAGTVSYLHMHMLVARHGQPGWVAALTSLSVDGMIVAASTTLLADSRSGRKGGVLPWALLVAGSVASLAANVAVAEPTVIRRPGMRYLVAHSAGAGRQAGDRRHGRAVSRESELAALAGQFPRWEA